MNTDPDSCHATPPRPRWLGTAALGLGVATAVGCLAFAARGATHWVQVSQWPTTDAIVNRAYVDRDEGSSTVYGDGDTYTPVIGFEYELDGVHHKRDTRGVLGDVMVRSIAQSLVDRYPPGTTFVVAYNPQDPSEISTAEHLVVAEGLPVGVALTLAAFGLSAAVWGHRHRSRA